MMNLQQSWQTSCSYQTHCVCSWSSGTQQLPNTVLGGAGGRFMLHPDRTWASSHLPPPLSWGEGKIPPTLIFFFKWKINQHFPSNGNSEHFKCQFRTKFIEDFPENGNTQTVNSSFYLLNTTTLWCTTQCPSTHYFKVIQLRHTLIEIN